MLTPPVRLRNDAIAGSIMALVATTPPSRLAAAIESVLDENFSSRRARAATRDGKGSVRTGDPNTSVLAANQVNLAKQKQAILRVLYEYPSGLVAQVIAEKCGIKQNSISTRMKELVTVLRYVEEGQHAIHHEGSWKTYYLLTSKGAAWVRGQDTPVNQQMPVWFGEAHA